jgi:hypothetical protein
VETKTSSSSFKKPSPNYSLEPNILLLLNNVVITSNKQALNKNETINKKCFQLGTIQEKKKTHKMSLNIIYTNS